MKVGVRGKLFAVSLVLLLGVGLVSGLYLERGLKEWLESRIADDLGRSARAAAAMVEVAPQLSQLEEVDRLADRLGASTGARITIIARDGVVLGDSELDVGAVREVEDHGHRPEVLQALASGEGLARRYSVTLQTSMLYVAVPYARPDGRRGAARASTPLSEVDAAVTRLRVLLAIAGAIGLVLAVVMSWLASHLMTRTLRALVESTRDISRGERDRGLPATAADELGGLAGSFRRLKGELEESVMELRDERGRLDAILEGMSEAVLALDERQRITLANRAALELLGQTSALEGKPLLEVVRAPQLAELVERAQEARRSDEFDLVGAAPRRILARAAPLRATGGSVLVMHDVTEIRRLETMRRDFVANVSHELRTPISIIQANAETLLGGAMEDPAAARRFVEPIQRSAVRLGALIADLLDLSQIEAGEYALAPARMRLRPVAARVLGGLSERAASRGVTVDNEIDPELDVRADERALEQILTNLLDNALKYTAESGHVWLRAERDGEGVRVEVRDDGPGIEARHRERIFERFYRVDAGRSQDMGGTGLGLAIVKHLVTQLRGEVGVSPRSPSGCNFWFTLPAS